ncbi:MAG: hypothetical protein ACJAS1_005641 [Oleiphilaceae bacterium]|jgi:hypothetical protein
MQEKLIVLAATGQNFANLPPLFELYQTGDLVLILESAWAHEAGRTLPLSQFLSQKAINHTIEMVPDDLPDMMDKVSLLCSPHASRQMVIIANGNTKLFTLALYEALRDYQPSLAYGEREPCMSYFARGIHLGSELIRYTHDLDLPDILMVQNQEIYRGEAKRVWFKGQTEIEMPEEPKENQYGVDSTFTNTFHEVKYFKAQLKEVIKPTDSLGFIKNHQTSRWGAMVRSSFLFAEACAKLLHINGPSESLRPKAAARLESDLLTKGDKFALTALYKTLAQECLSTQKSNRELISPADWLISQLTDESLLTKYGFYLRVLLKCYGVSKKEADDPDTTQRFVSLLQSNNPNDPAMGSVDEQLMAIQVRMMEIGQALLTWAQESPKWIEDFTAKPKYDYAIGVIFEDYVTRRVLTWLNASENAKQIVQSVWTNIKVVGRGEKILHSELDILLMLKNGIVIHLECKSAEAPKKDLDARIANLAKLGILSRQVVCLPLYSDFSDYTSYQKMMKKFAETCFLTNIDFIAVDLPAQKTYDQIKAGAENPLDVKRFSEALDKLISPYRIK